MRGSNVAAPRELQSVLIQIPLLEGVTLFSHIWVYDMMLMLDNMLIKLVYINLADP